MGRFMCPRCESSISNTSVPNEHEGYYVSDSNLESLEYFIGKDKFDIYKWFKDFCKDANKCPYCGYVWTFEPTPEEGYYLDSPFRKDWKPDPLLTLECRNERCEDKGSYIRRSQKYIDRDGPFNCHTCGNPLSLKDDKEMK